MIHRIITDEQKTTQRQERREAFLSCDFRDACQQQTNRTFNIIENHRERTQERFCESILAVPLYLSRETMISQAAV